MKRQIIKSPLNLNLVKQHLRIYDDSEDEYIEDLGKSAIAYIEDWTAYNVNTYQTAITADYRKDSYIELPKYESMVSVKQGETDITDYEISEGNRCVYISFSTDYDSITIIYKEETENIGYLNQCINLIVGDWYENREASAIEQASKNTNVSITTSTALRRMLGMNSLLIK